MRAKFEFLFIPGGPLSLASSSCILAESWVLSESLPFSPCPSKREAVSFPPLNQMLSTAVLMSLCPLRAFPAPYMIWERYRRSLYSPNMICAPQMQ